MICIIDWRRIALRLLSVGRARWILIHLLVLSRLSRWTILTRCTIGARQDVGGRQRDYEVGMAGDSRVEMAVETWLGNTPHTQAEADRPGGEFLVLYRAVKNSERKRNLEFTLEKSICATGS